MEILKILFDNPIDVTPQYILQKKIKNLDTIGVSVRGIVQNEEFISDIVSLFQIEDDLQLPQSLRAQLVHSEEKFALFVGAGVSKLMGVPLWDELAEHAIDYLSSNKLLNFSEAEKIKLQKVSPKQKLSLFHGIIEKNEAKEFYSSYFRLKDKASKNPYEILARLKFPKFTTNLDENFEEALNSRKNKVGFTSETETATSETREKLEIISGDFFDGMLIKENALYKIHGSYPTMEKYSVITTNDYLEHYYVKDKLGGFLGSVFKNYIVIFIGCGMEEFEILQPVIVSSKEHHALIGTYFYSRPIYLESRRNILEKPLEYMPTVIIWISTDIHVCNK